PPVSGTATMAPPPLPARPAVVPPSAATPGPVLPTTGTRSPPTPPQPAGTVPPASNDSGAPAAAAGIAGTGPSTVASQKPNVANAADDAAAKLAAVAAELEAVAREREAAAAKPQAPAAEPEEQSTAAASEPASPAGPLSPLILDREPSVARAAADHDDDERMVVLARRVGRWRKVTLMIGTLAACLVALVAVEHTNPDLLPLALQPPRQVIELTRT